MARQSTRRIYSRRDLFGNRVRNLAEMRRIRSQPPPQTSQQQASNQEELRKKEQDIQNQLNIISNLKTSKGSNSSQGSTIATTPYSFVNVGSQGVPAAFRVGTFTEYNPTTNTLITKNVKVERYSRYGFPVARRETILKEEKLDLSDQRVVDALNRRISSGAFDPKGSTSKDFASDQRTRLVKEANERIKLLSLSPEERKKYATQSKENKQKIEKLLGKGYTERKSLTPSRTAQEVRKERFSQQDARIELNRQLPKGEKLTSGEYASVYQSGITTKEFVSLPSSLRNKVVRQTAKRQRGEYKEFDRNLITELSNRNALSQKEIKLLNKAIKRYTTKISTNAMGKKKRTTDPKRTEIVNKILASANLSREIKQKIETADEALRELAKVSNVSGKLVSKLERKAIKEKKIRVKDQRIKAIKEKKARNAMAEDLLRALKKGEIRETAAYKILKTHSGEEIAEQSAEDITNILRRGWMTPDEVLFASYLNTIKSQDLEKMRKKGIVLPLTNITIYAGQVNGKESIYFHNKKTGSLAKYYDPIGVATLKGDIKNVGKSAVRAWKTFRSKTPLEKIISLGKRGVRLLVFIANALQIKEIEKILTAAASDTGTKFGGNPLKETTSIIFKGINNQPLTQSELNKKDQIYRRLNNGLRKLSALEAQRKLIAATAKGQKLYSGNSKLLKLIKEDKDVQFALVIYGIILVTYGAGAIFGGASTGTSRFASVVRAASKGTSAAGDVLDVAFASMAGRKFLKNPTQENLIEALFFGTIGLRTIKRYLEVLFSTKYLANISNFEGTLILLGDLEKAQKARIKRLQFNYDTAKKYNLEKGQIKKLKKELDLAKDALKYTQDTSQYFKLLSKNKNAFLTEDYSKIVNNKRLMQLIKETNSDKLLRSRMLTHVTGSANPAKLYGQELQKLALSEKELVSKLDNSGLLYLKTSVSKPGKIKIKGKVEEEIFKVFKEDDVILGGANAMNLQVSKRYRRSTADIDGKAKNAKRTIKKLLGRLQKKAAKGRYTFKRGNHKGTYAIYDNVKKKNIVELTDVDKISPRIKKRFSYTRNEQGYLIETKYSLLWGKIDAVLKDDRFYRKGMKDIGDIEKLFEGKIKAKDLIRKYKNPKNVFEAVSAFELAKSGKGKVGKDRKKYLEDFIFFGLLNAFVGYGRDAVARKPFLKYIWDEILGKNKYSILLVNEKISMFPQKYMKLIKKAGRGELSASKMSTLRKDLVRYVEENKQRFFPGTRTSALGQGEIEVVSSAGGKVEQGLRLTKTGVNRVIYDKELREMITIFENVLEGKKFQKEKNILKRLKDVYGTEPLQTFKLRLTNPDLRIARRTLKSIRDSGVIKKKNLRTVFRILKKQLVRIKKALRKSFQEELNKLKKYVEIKNNRVSIRVGRVKLNITVKNEFLVKLNNLKKAFKAIKDITSSKVESLIRGLKNAKAFRKTKRNIVKAKDILSSKSKKVVNSVESLLGNLNIQYKFTKYRVTKPVKDLSDAAVRRIKKKVLQAKKLIRVKTLPARKKLISLVKSINNEMRKFNVYFRIKTDELKKVVQLIKKEAKKPVRKIKKGVNQITSLLSKKSKRVVNSVESLLGNLNIRYKFTKYRVTKPVKDLSDAAVRRIKKKVLQAKKLIRVKTLPARKKLISLVNGIKKELKKFNILLETSKKKIASTGKAIKKKTAEQGRKLKKGGEKIFEQTAKAHKKIKRSIKSLFGQLNINYKFTKYRISEKVRPLFKAELQKVDRIIRRTKRKIRLAKEPINKILLKFSRDINETLFKANFIFKLNKRAVINLSGDYIFIIKQKVGNKVRKVVRKVDFIKHIDKTLKKLNRIYNGFVFRLRYKYGQLKLKVGEFSDIVIMKLKRKIEKIINRITLNGKLQRGYKKAIKKIKSLIPIDVDVYLTLKERGVLKKGIKKRVKKRSKSRRGKKAKKRTPKQKYEKKVRKEKLKKLRAEERKARKEARKTEKATKRKTRKRRLKGKTIARSKKRTQRKTKTRTRTRERTKQRTRSRQRTRTRERARQRTRSRQRTRTRERTRQRTRSRQRTRTRERTRQRTRSRQRTRTRERARQRTRSRQRTRTRIRTRPRPRIITLPGSDKETKARSYTIFIKKGGQKSRYVALNKGKYKKGEAINLARYVVDNTPLASFMIKPDKKKPTNSFKKKVSASKFRKPKGKSKLPHAVLVERSKARIDTRGEKLGITIAGLKKLRTQRDIVRFIKKKTKRRKSR